MIRMIPERSIKLRQQAIEELLTAIREYCESAQAIKTPGEYYEQYLLAKLYTKVRTRQFKMVDGGKLVTSMKFDIAEALLIATIVTRSKASVPLNQLLSEVGVMLPASIYKQFLV